MQHQYRVVTMPSLFPHPLVLASNKEKLLSAVALGAFLGLNICTAKADDTKQEIRLLKAEIKRLEEKVAREEQQVRRIAKNPKMPPVADVPIVCKDAPCPPPPPLVFVSFANGLQVDSWDDAFSFRIGGRIFVDGGVNTQPVEAFPPPGTTLPVGERPYLPSHNGSGFSNQVGFRQVRLEVLGKAFHDWEYKFQYDFNGAPNGLVVGGIRDAYLAWRSFMPVTFQTGYFFEPDGLERSASLNKYRDFIERTGAGELMGGNRHIGLAAVTGGDAPGLLGKPNWRRRSHGRKCYHERGRCRDRGQFWHARRQFRSSEPRAWRSPILGRGSPADLRAHPDRRSLAPYRRLLPLPKTQRRDGGERRQGSAARRNLKNGR
jgi:hypothetical protein